MSPAGRLAAFRTLKVFLTSTPPLQLVKALCYQQDYAPSLLRDARRRLCSAAAAPPGFEPALRRRSSVEADRCEVTVVVRSFVRPSVVVRRWCGGVGELAP